MGDRPLRALLSAEVMIRCSSNNDAKYSSCVYSIASVYYSKSCNLSFLTPNTDANKRTSNEAPPKHPSLKHFLGTTLIFLVRISHVGSSHTIHAS